MVKRDDKSHRHERAMILRVRHDPGAAMIDRIHTCQLAERFLDRLEMDAKAPPPVAASGDTPRADAERRSYPGMDYDADGEFVDLSFARQLERELAVVREHLLAKCETAWQRADEATMRAMKAEAKLDRLKPGWDESARSAIEPTVWKQMPEDYTPSNHGHSVIGIVENKTLAFYSGFRDCWFTIEVKLPPLSARTERL